MIYWIERGNIFKLKNVKNYAHGCNCSGAMGKGIALQFRYKFPEMYFQYKSLCKEGNFNLGDVFIYYYEEGIIFNLGTQKSWKTKANYEAIFESLKKMLAFCSKENVSDIVIPRLGAGLGGANWNKVKSILTNLAKEYNNVNIFVVENFDDISLNKEKVINRF